MIFREKPAARPAPTVKVRTIAREHAGKSAKLACMLKGPLAGPQASGLELTADEPRRMTSWMMSAIEVFKSLQHQGLVSTLNPVATDYHLVEADEIRVIYQPKEVIGQVLTHATVENDDKTLIARYDGFVADLAHADVLEVLIDIAPADGSKDDEERFANDLLLHVPYLRKALQLRLAAPPVAVALLLGKLDTRFASEAEAREALTDEVLRKMLGPFVSMVEGSAKVAFGGIFPISSFGFGNAVPAAAPANSARAGNGSAGGSSPLSRGEVEWILRSPSPVPFNLTALVWWEMLAGLLLKPANGHGDLARIAGLLRNDLVGMSGWYLPLQCRGGQATP